MFYGTVLLKRLLIWGQRLLQNHCFWHYCFIFKLFFLSLWSLFSVVVLGKGWLQIYWSAALSQALEEWKKKCLHLFKISTVQCCGSWATGRNSQKLGCTCSIVSYSCVIWGSAQRSLLAVCSSCYVFCVLWVWKILIWCRPWTITWLIIKLTIFSKSFVLSLNYFFFFNSCWLP